MRRVRPAPGTFPAMASSSRSPRETRADPLEIRGSTYGNEEFDSVAMRGAPLVVNVWYAACPPCRVEAPALEAAHAEYSVLGVGFVGVNTRDKAGPAAAFEQTFGIKIGRASCRERGTSRRSGTCA